MKYCLEHVKIKWKHFIETWGSKIEIKIANPNEIMELHRDTDKSLTHTMDDKGKENDQLKYRIAKLEATISPKSFFSRPLSIVKPIKDAPSHSWKFEKIIRLLVGVCSFIVKNIKGIIDIVSESYKVLENVE